MKIEIANIETDVKTLKELRQALKDAKDAMVSAEKGTEEYNNALKQTANIQHELRDMQAEINANADDFGQKISNVSKTINGFNGAITSATGALALMGVQNKEVQNQITATMTSLLAMTNGLSQIDEGVKAIKRLKAGLEQGTIAYKAAAAAQWALNAAQEAMPLIALTAGIITLIKTLSSLKGAYYAAKSGADALLETQRKFNEQIDRYSHITDLNIQVLRIQGKTEKEILEYQLQRLQTQKEMIDQNIKGQAHTVKEKKALEEQSKVLAEQIKLVGLKIKYYKEDTKAVKDNTKAVSDNKEELSDYDKIVNKLKDDTKDLSSTEKDRIVNSLTKGKELTGEQIDEIEKLVEAYLKEKQAIEDVNKFKEEQAKLTETLNAEKVTTELEALQVEYDKRVEMAHGNKELLLQVDEWYQNESKRITEEGEKAKKDISLQMGFEMADGIISIMNSLASAMDSSNEKQFKAKQSMEIASATINTITGSIKAYMSAWDTYGSIPFVGSGLATAFSVIQAATVAAAGAAQIATIARQKYKGGSGNVGKMSASPNINTAALSAASKPVDTVTTVRGASTEASIKDTRVYVLESDITDTQNRVKTIESESKF